MLQFLEPNILVVGVMSAIAMCPALTMPSTAPRGVYSRARATTLVGTLLNGITSWAA